MNKNFPELQKKAIWVRKQILEMIFCAKKGHIGGALSCTDILVALYYGKILRFDAKRPEWEERDRFILSKGHSAVALYAVLADLGFFPLQELQTFCRNGAMLGGHPDRNIPGIEVNTGSLGQGLGIGGGLAWAAKTDKKEHLTYVLLGDGECHEGSVWEAALFCGHHRLNNLVAIVDYNQQCAQDRLEGCLGLEPFADKWRSFGWQTRDVDGHSFGELLAAFADVRKSERPQAIIARTIKGKGISFMEGKVVWHHGVPNLENLARAQQELNKGILSADQE